MIEQIFDFTKYKPKFWQIATDQQGTTGWVASDLDDIAQSILLICTTRLGSDPGRPNFGCDVLHRIDAPMNAARITRGALDIRQAIERWEPRAKVLKVNWSISEQGQVTYNINWSALGQVQELSTSIEFPKIIANYTPVYSSSSTLPNGVYNPISQAVTTTSTGWQKSIQEFGSVVQGLADLSQAIILILTTKPGTDPGRPNFGCGLFDFIDKPIAVAAPNIAAKMREALRLWETRIAVKKIVYEFGDDNGTQYDTLKFQVFWTLAGGDLPNATSSITLGPAPGVLPESPNRRILVTSTDLTPILTNLGQNILV